MFWCTLEECEDCVHILFLWKCFTESLSSFLVGSHLESLLLCISDSYIPSDCSGLVWVSVSSVSMAFYFFFLTHGYPQISNKTWASHMCLCFWWWHAPMFLWKLVLFFQKVKLLLTVILKTVTISCNMFYLTAISWITHPVNKLNPAWKTY